MTDLRTARTTVHRLPQRGVYDRETIYAVLDEAPICHVGFVVEAQPFVLPTIHARIGDRLYLHGANTNRMLNTLRAGAPACVTVTVLDGLVLARSAFHHSMNYRSVVILGIAKEVTDTAEKAAAFDALVNHVLPGRAAEARRPNRNETRATAVVALPIDEASAKVRTGGPRDAAEDMHLPIWAGTVSLELKPGVTVPEPDLPASTQMSPAVERLITRGRR
jgi:nitroimidazol reductase NimA-like FMN-containing flavoprotein (pyridoxamine 5'-phosphate oxidase superfamily)